MGKTTISGGKTQLHLHDGRNIIFDSNPEYKSGDSIVISLPEQEIISHHKFEEGALSYLTGGSHIGETAVVKAHEIKRSSKDNEVTFEEDFGTISDYVFIIGAKKDIPLEVNE